MTSTYSYGSDLVGFALEGIVETVGGYKLFTGHNPYDPSVFPLANIQMLQNLIGC